MLVGLDEILALAEKGNFAIPAFNVYNMETVMGVIQAAQENQAPVILQVYSRLFQEGEARFLAPVILEAARSASVPVCFHIDHGAGNMEIARAIRYGCTGVMIDASMFGFSENVSATKTVVELAGFNGIKVEGELGHIGSVNDASMDEFTAPGDAAEYVRQTGVCALAVLVGNAHGRYKKPPKLDIRRIADIREAAGVPLVLHGGSGIPDEEVRRAIHAGIRKANFGTDLCYSFLDEVFRTPRELVAIDRFMKKPIAGVRDFAEAKIRLLQADGKAGGSRLFVSGMEIFPV